MAGKAIAKGLAALLKSDVPAPTSGRLIAREPTLSQAKEPNLTEIIEDDVLLDN